MNTKEASENPSFHLYPFHNLYFSLYDLVYLSEFEFEICIRMDGELII